jgi:hypothetical protein
MQSRRDETFHRTIIAETIDKNGEPRLHHGVAIIDPCSPCNLVSRRFSRLFLEDMETVNPYPCVMTVGGIAYAIRKMNARWHCLENPNIKNPLLRFDPTMQSSEFEIMRDGDCYDIIIGRPDIIKFGIMDIEKPPLTAALFRSARPTVNRK